MTQISEDEECRYLYNEAVEKCPSNCPMDFPDDSRRCERAFEKYIYANTYSMHGPRAYCTYNTRTSTFHKIPVELCADVYNAGLPWSCPAFGPAFADCETSYAT